MTPLDEKALRRPGWSEGTTVTLGDGQDWTFPRPVLRFYPVRAGDGDGGGRFTIDGRYCFDDDFTARFEQLVESEDLAERLAIQLELAAGLLCRNYDLDDRAIRRLLYLVPGDETNRSMWAEVNAILTGQSAPKPLPDGSS